MLPAASHLFRADITWGHSRTARISLATCCIASLRLREGAVSILREIRKVLSGIAVHMRWMAGVRVHLRRPNRVLVLAGREVQQAGCAYAYHGVVSVVRKPCATAVSGYHRSSSIAQIQQRYGHYGLSSLYTEIVEGTKPIDFDPQEG